VNRFKHVLYIFFFTICISGCSAYALNENAVDYYKKERPLEVDIVVPEPILLNEPQFLKVILKQDGEVVTGANDVRFTIWKKDVSTAKEVIVAKDDGNGEYSVEKTFHEDGLYYVKVQASSKGSTVMPTKQLIVGNLTEEELHDLQKNSPKQIHNHEGHH